MTTDHDTALRKVAALVSAALRDGLLALEDETYPVTLLLGPDALAGPEAVEKALRAALGVPGPRSVTYDMSVTDAYSVQTAALEDFSADQRDRARHEGGNPRRHQWADLADEMRRQAEAAWEARDGK